MSENDEKLEKFFPGDDAWKEFVDLYSEGERFVRIEEVFSRFEGNDDVALVICGYFQEHAVAWIGAKVPALGGLTPAECLASAAGVQRLKTVLMRLP